MKQSLSLRVFISWVVALATTRQVESFSSRSWGAHSATKNFRLLATSETSSGEFCGPSRRETIQAMLATAAFFTTSSTPAVADTPISVVSPLETLQRLRSVPTFTLVDSDGIPFMTYETETATANGYFFLDYMNAQAVLEDAKLAFEKAKDTQKDVYNNWGESRIVTLPLDFSMRLTVTQTSNEAQNGKSFRTNYQVLPSAEDLESAVRRDNSVRYRQRGRVPLFYVNEPLRENETPVFFSTKDLKMEWNQKYPDQPLLNSRIQVRELSETFRAMIKPGGTDESVRDIVFVPSPEAVKQAQVLRPNQQGEVYKRGKIILTSK